MWCRSLVEISTKLRHPKCRSLVEVWCRSLVDILSNLLCISLTYRANFDQTSAPTSFKRSAQCAVRSARCAVRSARSRIPRRIPEIPWRILWRIPWRIPSATKVYLEGYLQQQPWDICTLIYLRCTWDTLRDHWGNNETLRDTWRNIRNIEIPSMYMRYLNKSEKTMVSTLTNPFWGIPLDRPRPVAHSGPPSGYPKGRHGCSRQHEPSGQQAHLHEEHRRPDH